MTSPKRVSCPRCDGKGYRTIITGPLLVGPNTAFPGGPLQYDCGLRRTSGECTARQAAQWLRSAEGKRFTAADDT